MELVVSLGKFLQDLHDKLAVLEAQNVEFRKENQALQTRVRILEVRMASSENALINLSPQNLGKHTHRAFAFFPKLPAELRCMIWILARPEPRVVKIFISKDRNRFYSTAKVPTLLQICQESRRIAKQWYKLCFRKRVSPIDFVPRVYFDFSSDFLYVPSNGSPKGDPTRSNCYPYDLLVGDTEKVQKVVCEVTPYSEMFRDIANYFPVASEALLILREEGMLEGSAACSDFRTVTDEFGWQRGRTLQQVYRDVSQIPNKFCSK